MAVVMKDICFSYEKSENIVLSQFSLTLEEGSITTLMAESGKGKTTVLRILAGLERPQSGTLSGLEGRRIGMVFQEDRLCEYMSAMGNIKLVCGKNIGEVQIFDELESVGLTGIERKPVSKLSGGMKRRVALMRALLSPADLLLLDEPFKGIDEENKKKCIQALLRHGEGKTVLVVTHDGSETRAIGGRILSFD